VEHFESILGQADRRGEPSLISHISSIESVFFLDDFHEMMIDLTSDLHGMREVPGSSRKEHYLLESHAVSTMLASIDDVEGRSRQDILRFTIQFGQRSDVFIERNVSGSGSSSSNGQRNG
jgi:hypothetical protein